MRRVLARLLMAFTALGLVAAAPLQRGLSLEIPSGPDLPTPPTLPTVRHPTTAFQPAPLPNRDVDGPAPPKAGTEASLRPSVFTRGDSYRGDGFNPGSTAQTEQDKRAHPGAGFSLKMPLTGQ